MCVFVKPVTGVGLHAWIISLLLQSRPVFSRPTTVEWLLSAEPQCKQIIIVFRSTIFGVNNRPVKRLTLVARLPLAFYIVPHAD